MAKMLVEDTSLTTVANAIRTKGGTTGALTFPDGFVSAIDGIKTGSSLTPIVDKSITEVTADMLDGCTTIGEYAFYKCNLTSISIPNSVTSIEVHAFEYNALTNVTIPESVTSLKGYAFQYCRSLVSVVINGGITTIYGSTFAYCTKLTSVVIPESVTQILDQAFLTCALTSVVIPSGVTSIGARAFYYNDLVTVEMKPTTPPSISSNTFQNCTRLKTIKVPSASLNAYKSATNWSAYADKMVGV